VFRTVYLKNTKPKGKKNRLGSVAKKTIFGGRKYDSKMEGTYAANLEYRRRAGEIVEINPQFRIDIKINGKHWRYYKVDFRVVRADGFVEYHEVKGYATEEWKMKWDALHILKDELLEPGAELILITK
jgi:hypothetical protein